jgi:hypothetical protein
MIIALSSYSKVLGASFGNHFRYEYVQDSVYDVYLTLYRDCRGIGLYSPINETKIRCLSGGKGDTLDLKLQSITSINIVCAKEKDPCTPPNSRAGQGIEEHIYKARIDFRTAFYKSYYNCGNVIIEWARCCRNSSLTNVGSGMDYNYMEIDFKKAQKSNGPKFLDPANPNLSCNQKATIYAGADDSDADSLSYSLTSAMVSYGTSIRYNKGYSFDQPFTHYDPTGKGVINPELNPPHGTYMDKKTGLLIFTPTNCYEHSLVVVEVKEWRKDSSNTFQVISTTRREMQFFVLANPYNNAPLISPTTSTYHICDGEAFELKLISSDRAFVPPPPNNPYPLDSVDLQMLKSIKGSSFRIDSSSRKQESGFFTWTPNLKNKEVQSFPLVVKVQDNFCPAWSWQHKKIEIKVYPKIKSKIVADSLDCRTWALAASNDLKIEKQTQYIWRLYSRDTILIVDQKVGYLFSSKEFGNIKYRDTLKLFKNGDYLIGLKSLYCDDEVYIPISKSNEISIFTSKDSALCEGQPFEFQVSNKDTTRVQNISWTYGTKQSTDWRFEDSIRRGLNSLSYRLTSMEGCKDSATIIIRNIRRPFLSELADTVVCKKISFTYYAVDSSAGPNGNLQYLWSNGNTSDSMRVSKAGNYWIKTSNQCGIDSQSFTVSIDLDPQISLGPNHFICETDSISIGLKAAIPGISYLWNTGSTEVSIVVQTPGFYSLTGLNTCGSSTDEIKITAETAVETAWPNNIVLCKGIPAVIDLGNYNKNVVWNDGNRNHQRSILNPGLYSFSIKPLKCPEVTDTIWAEMSPELNVNIGADTFIKKPFSIILDAQQIGGNYRWSTGETTRSIIVKDFGTYWVEMKNACDTVRDSILISESVSVVDLDELSSIKIVPNPNRGVFFLELDNEEILTLEMFTLDGKTVPCTFKTEGKRVHVKTLNVPCGIYLLNIRTESGTYSGKVLMLDKE